MQVIEESKPNFNNAGGEDSLTRFDKKGTPKGKRKNKRKKKRPQNNA